MLGYLQLMITMERSEYIDIIVEAAKKEKRHVQRVHPHVGVTLTLTCDETIVSKLYHTMIIANNNSWRIYLMDARVTRYRFANSEAEIEYKRVMAERKRFFSFNSANQYALERILTDTLVVASKTGIEFTVEPRVLANAVGINRSNLYNQKGKYSDIWGTK
jgi:hypothetical protein